MSKNFSCSYPTKNKKQKTLLYDDSLSFERIFQTWTRLTSTNLFAEMASPFFSGSVFLVLFCRALGSFTADKHEAFRWLMRLRNSLPPNPALLIPTGNPMWGIWSLRVCDLPTIPFIMENNRVHWHIENCTKDGFQTCVFKGHNPVCVFVLSALDTQTRFWEKGRLFTRTKHMIVHNYIFS